MSALARRPRNLGFYLGFLVFTVLVLFPFYWITISAFTPITDLLRSPPQFLPGTLTLDNFREMLDSLPFDDYFMNSLIFAAGSALLSVVVSFIAAYAFARYEFRGRNLLFIVFMLSAALPQMTTIIPLFRLLRDLDLVNTRHGLILLMGSLLIPFTIWLLTSFIRQVPVEIEEAARMDGGGLLTVMRHVVIPLTMPALATLFLINFIITWNELFYPLVFASSTDSKTLTRGLLELTKGVGTGAGRPWDLMSALSLTMMVPVVVLVVAFQRLIVQGLTQGASR